MRIVVFIIVVLQVAVTGKLNASPEQDAKTVAALDTKYQAAVKSNDAATMDQILADDFALVTGRGKVSSKADLIESARKRKSPKNLRTENLEHRKAKWWAKRQWLMPPFGPRPCR